MDKIKISANNKNNVTRFNISIFLGGKLHSEDWFLIDRRLRQDEILDVLESVKEAAIKKLLSLGAKKI